MCFDVALLKIHINLECKAVRENPPESWSCIRNRNPEKRTPCTNHACIRRRQSSAVLRRPPNPHNDPQQNGKRLPECGYGQRQHAPASSNSRPFPVDSRIPERSAVPCGGELFAVQHRERHPDVAEAAVRLFAHRRCARRSQ